MSFLAGAGGARADIIFSDSEFPASNWGLESVSVGGAGTATATQITFGGNPGNGRRIEQHPGAGAGSAIWTLSRYGTTSATTYDPAASGAIGTLSFAIDYFQSPAAVGLDDQFVYAALKQGTVIFVGPGVNTHQTPLAWRGFSSPGLTGADFTALGGTAHPDFTGSGAPIRFGFLAFAARGSNGVASGDYDNFSVRIVPVPGPGAVGLAGLGGVAAARRRRRATRAVT